tara:strand:+ start:2255 stop:2473 length:219 start_codon:yes stop_codon:yes gene_type:complete
MNAFLLRQFKFSFLNLVKKLNPFFKIKNNEEETVNLIETQEYIKNVIQLICFKKVENPRVHPSVGGRDPTFL